MKLLIINRAIIWSQIAFQLLKLYILRYVGGRMQFKVGLWAANKEEEEDKEEVVQAVESHSVDTCVDVFTVSQAFLILACAEKVTLWRMTTAVTYSRSSWEGHHRRTPEKLPQ